MTREKREKGAWRTGGCTPPCFLTKQGGCGSGVRRLEVCSAFWGDCHGWSCPYHYSAGCCSGDRELMNDKSMERGFGGWFGLARIFCWGGHGQRIGKMAGGRRYVRCDRGEGVRGHGRLARGGGGVARRVETGCVMGSRWGAVKTNGRDARSPLSGTLGFHSGTKPERNQEFHPPIAPITPMNWQEEHCRGERPYLRRTGRFECSPARHSRSQIRNPKHEIRNKF